MKRLLILLLIIALPVYGSSKTTTSKEAFCGVKTIPVEQTLALRFENKAALSPCSDSEDLERLFKAVCKVESNLDSTAVGVNHDRGIAQITPILQLDYLNRTGKIIDPFRVKDSREVFMYYAKLHGPDQEKIARRWNAWSNWQGKQATYYWEKVKNQLHKLN